MKGGDKRDRHNKWRSHGTKAAKNQQEKAAIIGDTLCGNNHRFDYLDVYLCETAGSAKSFLQVIARQNTAMLDGLIRMFPVEEQFLLAILKRISKKVKCQ